MCNLSSFLFTHVETAGKAGAAWQWTVASVSDFRRRIHDEFSGRQSRLESNIFVRWHYNCQKSLHSSPLSLLIPCWRLNSQVYMVNTPVPPRCCYCSGRESLAAQMLTHPTNIAWTVSFLPGPFLLSYSVFDLIWFFLIFVVSGLCARLSWLSRQLLSAR